MYARPIRSSLGSGPNGIRSSVHGVYMLYYAKMRCERGRGMKNGKVDAT